MNTSSHDALIVVDVQNDFCPGGALAVAEGDRIVPVINKLMTRFRRVVLTRDWHPANHCSFAEGAPKFVDGSWPPHCVAGTPGAAFCPGLAVPQDCRVVSKGQTPEKEAYSGFDGTGLAETLRMWDVRRVFVCGLATDYCVKATALDGRDAGFEVVLIRDACRGVDASEGVPRALDQMAAAGVTQIGSEELL